MHPVLLRLGPLRIFSFGAFVALGGLWAAMIAWRRRARMGLAGESAFWLYVNTMLLSGYAGGKLFYVLVYHTGDFWQAWTFSSGFSFMGGFASIFLGLVWLARYLEIPVLPLFDYSCAIAPLWHAVGRLGCLAAGCCYGRPAPGLPWAIAFSDPRAMVARPLLGVPLHPTQLYEFAGELAIGAYLNLSVLPRVEKGRYAPGTLSAAYLTLYAVLRFALEFFRGDTVPWRWGLSAAQAASLALVPGALILACWARRHAPRPR